MTFVYVLSKIVRLCLFSGKKAEIFHNVFLAVILEKNINLLLFGEFVVSSSRDFVCVIH